MDGQKQKPKEGYVKDFVSGVAVRATPEEVEAVQVFSRMLVDDYEYPKSLLQTRPQWRVKARPSDVKKEYPVDIAVFAGRKHSDENIHIIVECKQPSKKEGRKQLEDYLRLSRSQLGVWFNGDEKLYLKKVEAKGQVLFEQIPNIPKHGERVEDVGLYKRKDLKPAHNLKSVFRTVRNHLAANAVGITLDEVFAQQIINLIFCKIYDERFTKPEDAIKFRAGIGEAPVDVRQRVSHLFLRVKEQYNDVIDAKEELLLDDVSLTYVVGELQRFCISDSERDAIADAFETFIGPSLKGSQGQFFTPRHVVKLVMKMIKPQMDEKIIDPACGSGGFIIEALRDVWRHVEERGQSFNWPTSEIDSEKQKVAIKNLRGIDKDSFLSKVAKAYMAIIGDGRGGVFCENALDLPGNWKSQARENVVLGSFDAVVTNPPFGNKMKVIEPSILQSYRLGHKWKYNKSEEEFEELGTLHAGQAPQILFVERCLALLKDGGRLGIIAPESMFCNPSHRHIVQYIKSVARINAIISMPEELFQPHTHAKTCAVVVEKTPTDPNNPHAIFMAIAKWCGHDSRGHSIPHDDLPKILERYLLYQAQGRLSYDHWGFIIDESQIVDNIYLPKYYNPEIQGILDALQGSHDLLRLGDLVDQGVVSLITGDEVGKLAYGTGDVPFVRTSDIANWEVKLDPKHLVSQEIYDQFKVKQDVQENDILMVRDGTYLVGTCAIVTQHDTKILFQSHIYKIRSNDRKILHPYLLLAVLSSPVVKAQIAAKRFTQDIIDSLGGRIHELVLPVPKDANLRQEIIQTVRSAVRHKSKARALSEKAMLEVAAEGDGRSSSADEFPPIPR